MNSGYVYPAHRHEHRIAHLAPAHHDMCEIEDPVLEALLGDHDHSGDAYRCQTVTNPKHHRKSAKPPTVDPHLDRNGGLAGASSTDKFNIFGSVEQQVKECRRRPAETAGCPRPRRRWILLRACWFWPWTRILREEAVPAGNVEGDAEVKTPKQKKQTKPEITSNGKVIITDDGATIPVKMEVLQPAATVFVGGSISGLLKQIRSKGCSRLGTAHLGFHRVRHDSCSTRPPASFARPDQRLLSSKLPTFCRDSFRRSLPRSLRPLPSFSGGVRKPHVVACHRLTIQDIFLYANRSATHRSTTLRCAASGPSLSAITNSISTSNEFRMFSFKVWPCSRAYSYDWTECPFVHPDENAQRRDPHKYH